MRRVSVLLALLLCLAPLARADGAAPVVLPQQGRLLDGSDKPVDGQVSMKVAFYEAPVAPGTNPESALWSEQYDVTVTDGLYVVNIGDSYGGTKKALDPAVFVGGAVRYLQMTVNDTVLTPRLRVGVVPSALDAANLGGHAPNYYAAKADLDDATATLTKALSDEATARDAAIALATTNLQTALTNESAAQTSALQTETAARTSAIQGEADARTSAVSAEASARTAADATKLDLAGGTMSGPLAAPSISASGNVTAGQFSGSGAGLTNVPAGSLTGTVADAQIPTAAKLAGNNAFSGSTNSFAGNVGVGTTAPGTHANQNQTTWPSYSSLAHVVTVQDSAHPPVFEFAGAPQNAGDQVGGIWFTNLGGQSDAHYQIASIVGERGAFGGNANIVGGRLLFQTKVSGNGTLNQMLFDENGHLGINTATPGATLEVNGDFIRTIARWQGYSGDGTDNGPLAGRTVAFSKKQANTGLRVTWSDNFRVATNNGACRWEVLFNGASCANPGGLYLDKYEGNTNSNRHDPATFVGTCFGLAAGPVTVSTRVGPSGGYAAGMDCYTGWNNQLVSLEVEEVR